MAEAVLGVGGNLGARRAILRAASAMLDALPGCRVLARSALYETPPLGPPQPDYLNAALRVSWSAPPEALLRSIQALELAFGRERRVRWGPRTLDIDVLHWSEGPITLPGLEVPHRELGQRAFALGPLLDVAPELAPRWEAALLHAGGRPPLAEPSWCDPRLQEALGESAWQADESELLADALSLACRLVERAPTGAEPEHPRARELRSFVLPAVALPELLTAELERSLQAALSAGFVPCAAAILGCDEGTRRGVWLGEHGGAAHASPRLEVQLERSPDGRGRVRLRRGVTDDGFEFG